LNFRNSGQKLSSGLLLADKKIMSSSKDMHSEKPTNKTEKKHALQPPSSSLGVDEMMKALQDGPQRKPGKVNYKKR
jgi:hypothetical protein